MLRRSAVIASIVTALVGSVAQAQVSYWWAGGGPILPMGDSKKAFDTGWMLDAGIARVIVPKHSSLQLQVSYGSNPVKSSTLNSTLYSAFGNITYGLLGDDAKLSPYVYGGLGIVSTKTGGTYSTSRSDFGYQGAGGVSYTINKKWSAFGEARYMSAGSGTTRITIMPLLFGFSANVGVMP